MAMLTPFAVIRGGRAFFVALLSDGSVVTKAGRVPFAFDPVEDVVTTEGQITSAITRRGAGLVTSGSAALANLEFRPGRFAGIGARELVYGHPNLASVKDKEDLIAAIYVAAGVDYEIKIAA